ncbi:MAG: YcaO-like family protein [Bacteroidales bacterium]|nr:YcaO-like family protein [Bacteroidales bacterium]
MSTSSLNELYRLRSFFNRLGLVIIETDITSEHSLFHSANVEFGNIGLRNLGLNCNGNGTKYLDALLSAYGELVERIQNNSFFGGSHLFEDVRNLWKFKDEKFQGKIKEVGIDLIQSNNKTKRLTSIDKLSCDGVNILQTIFGIKEVDDLEELIESKYKTNKVEVQDFIKTSDSSIVQLPLAIMQNFSSVNGMCSGKTKADALIRGISEVIEKHSIWRIYFEEEGLETIAREKYHFLKVYNKIKELEMNNYSIRFFDCSFKTKLPIVGTLIINRNNNTYAFSVSCHPHFETALERGLVKVFKIDRSDKFNSIDFDEDIIVKKEYFRSITDGSGKWPSYIFDSKPENLLIEENFINSTLAKEQLSYLIDSLLPEKEVYIRDVSSNEMMSFYVYIPTMSEIVFRTNIHDYWSTQEKLNSAANLFHKGIRNLSFSTNINGDELYEDDFRLAYLYQNNNSFLSLDLLIVKALISITNQNYVHAELFFYEFIKKNGSSKFIKELPSPIVFLDFTQSINKGNSINQTTELLIKYYCAEDIMLIRDIFIEKILPKNIFKIPTCYNCSVCPAEENCHLFDAMKVYWSIQNSYSNLRN